MTDYRDDLINQIFASDSKEYTNKLTTDAKELTIKKVLSDKIVEIIHALNLAFLDVHFRAVYGYDTTGKCTEDTFHVLVNDVYDSDANDDDPRAFNRFYYEDQDTGDEYLSVTPLQDILLKVEYYWERNCSLGCRHRTKRFHIFSLAKILEIVQYWSLEPRTVRTLVKEYIPDFFYDPMVQPKKKRGRPRKDECSYGF